MTRPLTVFAHNHPVTEIRIAICDDHPVFRAGVSGALATQRDMRVVAEAGSARELHDKLDREPADLVLLDAEMPGQSGLEALPALAARARVLMFSAYDDPERVKRAMQLGAIGYLSKDASPGVLFRSIREAAAGQTVLDVELASRVAKSLRKAPDQASFERRLRSLTPRQREVLKLLGDGEPAREIARRISITEGTAKNHVTRILQLLEVEDRAKLVHLLKQYKVEG
jgi:two-component system nitrate/nitrite response regulator NarL